MSRSTRSNYLRAWEGAAGYHVGVNDPVGSLRDDAALSAAAHAIREADALLIAAGAGMGVDSGLPDFRGTEGFWRAYPAVAKLGLRFEEMATPVWFKKDPHLAWAFYGHRLHLYRDTAPHAGFSILRSWAATKQRGGFVFTSNVDGHFQRAGFDPGSVVECHGSLMHVQCMRRGCGGIEEASGIEVRIDAAVFRALDPLPRCARCGEVMRPNVLMFGDGGWDPDRTARQEARMEAWLGTLGRESRLVVVEMGAGMAVPTVRASMEHLVQVWGGRLIRINPREPSVPPGRGHVGLGCGALEGLRALEARMGA
ncbi:MAG: NAD-dependent protein deacetylase [Verrucomicrobiales bacterium]|nr:NAD-dependent protein deacetylase [Verrucomicrobiales bacterium]